MCRLRVRAVLGRRGDTRQTDRVRGAVLIEILIALALLGVLATSFIGGMYTSLQAARVSDEKSVALTLAQSELEFVRQQPYSVDDWGYTVDTTTSGAVAGWNLPSWWADSPSPPLSPDLFAGYSVTVTAAGLDLDGSGEVDPGIRRLSVTVYLDGDEMLTLNNYEIDR